jgi:acetylornithine/succinyldiaminopimelate/putrescine aminotransferase
VSNLGHKHPEIIKAVSEQAGDYMHLMVYGEYVQRPQVRLAEMIAHHLPEELSTTYFVNSGSEAIEGAMKLAKRITGRPEIAAFKNAYHGSTQGALSILGNEDLRNAFRPLIPGTLQLEFNNIQDLRKINQDTACVVVETIQAEAGIIPASQEFMKALRGRCDETGALLVIDDIQMGIGRTGKLFSFEHYGIIPDILALAKALGAGMPIGAFISSKDKMACLASKPELGHITTFGGHPVSAAAALQGLTVIIREGLPAAASAKGRLFTNLLKGHRVVKEIRGPGLMMAVDLGLERKIEKLIPLLMDRGLLVDRFLFNRTSFRIAPPLTITEEEFHEVGKLLLECLDVLD